MIRRETVHVEVDDAVIAAGNLRDAIAPVWWQANIYDGPLAYEKSLEPFSRPQRLVHAVRWYAKEAGNGGHEQFFSNSAGVVWRDALVGLAEVGIPRGANILKIASERFVDPPSLDRDERNDQLDSESPDCEDVDEALGALLEKVDIDECLMSYVRSRPADFYFSGNITRVVLPGQ